jgi:hypothetical protein
MMKKVLGSHAVVSAAGETETRAVLECGHETPYGKVKWVEGIGYADCPEKEHDAEGKALRPAGAPAPATVNADDTGPQPKE